MGAATRKKSAIEGRLSERRHRRSGCLADALRLQLETCREAEGLAAIVVSDEFGVCVAHAGGDGSHDQLAAHLPMLADPLQRQSPCADAAALLPAPESMTVTTFPIPGGRLHACAVAVPENVLASPDGTAVLARVASGFTRLLAE